MIEKFGYVIYLGREEDRAKGMVIRGDCVVYLDLECSMRKVTVQNLDMSESFSLGIRVPGVWCQKLFLSLMI